MSKRTIGNSPCLRVFVASDSSITAVQMISGHKG